MADFVGKTTELDYIEKPKIDLKDRKILSVISKNSRLMPTQIGKIVGLSKEVVYYRIKNLKKNGIIREYITVINPAKLGMHIFIVYLQVQNLSEAKETQLINRLIAHPATHYITHCLGKYDIAFDIIATSIKEFDALLGDLLKEFGQYIKHYEISQIVDVLKYVHLTESFSNDLSLNRVKYIDDSSFVKYLQNLKIDYNASKVKLDKKDLQLFYFLSNNSTLQLKQLATNLNISSDTIKYRIKKLINQNIILGFLPIINVSMLGYHTYGILIQLNHLTFHEKERILRYLAIHPDIFFCLKTTGQYDITLNVSITNNLHLYKFINDLKQRYPEQIKTIEMFLVIKDYKIAFLPNMHVKK